MKKLWFVSSEGKRVQVWSLTPSGYTLAEEVLGKQLKIPRHDVASQFLEHATGVNELYVALTKTSEKPQAEVAIDRRGKPANDFARLPTAFRWLPSEELELPFEEYVPEKHHLQDRRLQPDAMLEDPARKRRYLIEYETGSASVRNAQHKSATLTKLGRYWEVLWNPRGRYQTVYEEQFTDKFEPILLFMTRTSARRDTIAEATKEWLQKHSRSFEVRIATVEEISRELRAQVLGDKAPVPVAAPRALAGVAGPPIPPPGWATLSPREMRLISGVIEETIQTLRHVRHTVRAGRRVEAEPRYPQNIEAVRQLLQTFFEKNPGGA